MNTIAAACLLDWIAGDPEWLPHPVRLIGRSAQAAEKLLRRPDQSEREELIAGAALTVAVVGLSYLGTAKAVRWGAGTLLAWTCLATRNLIDESLAVIRALEKPDLPHARERLARIVGRDTRALSETEVHRALIETLAESACDGIVAPLFYMAVNTLDSMIGHADRRYLYFGKAAARLDDAANYVPSRLTALGIVATAGMESKSALKIWRRDGNKHKSPNAGQPESAMAGALRVRLGGVNTYAGEPMEAPLLGAEFEQPKLHHAKRALRLVTAVSLLSAAAAVLVQTWRQR
jgi:adenosylcobinamide-phosphate synthase